MIIETTLKDGATVPLRATHQAAAGDLCAIEAMKIYPGETKLVKTGVAMAIPPGLAGLVCSRSGLALKNRIFVLNAPGVIDADYRGDIGVILTNMGGDVFEIKAGDRVAQLAIVPVFDFCCKVVTSLDETDRGTGGFGSTGVAAAA